MKPRSKQTVAVAYPYPSQVSARFHHSLLQLVVRDAATVRRINGFVANSSGANITNARNEIAAKFLATDADYLWFIDTDMVFDDDLLERLIAVAHPETRPIVGGLCFSWQKGAHARPTLYMVRRDGKIGSFWDYPADRLVEVDATGTGCLLIHRSVFEKMADKYPEPYRWFRETELGDLPVGEDITFCIRARALGVPVFVDTSIKVGHEKTFVVDEEVYRAQQASKRLEPPKEPTFAVIASKNRAIELYSLVQSLVGSAVTTFVLDNGYEDEDGPCNPISDLTRFDSSHTKLVHATNWPLHKMWNHGLELAEETAKQNGHKEWNVAVLNDDIRIEPDTLIKLARGLRADENIWISYPDHHGVVPEGQIAQLENQQFAGQTMSGWCFMVRGESGVRLDEQFQWWYGDSDLEKTVRAQDKFVVAVGGCHVEHLHPLESSRDPERIAQIREDEKRFAAKWDLDPDALWLAQNPNFSA